MDIITQPAHRLAEWIKTKQVSSTEVTRAFLQRIAEVNPRLNAVIEIHEEQTLAQARRADQALMKGELLGPLHGVPMTIKDSTNIIGYRSRYGSHLFDGYEAKQDGTCVARLRAAGAVFLGLTNVPELLTAYESSNLLYGTTNHPLDAKLSPGGSSGGEAAIIATQGSPWGLGSDGGGSIRIPAHFCGIAGIKATQGRIPGTGIMLPGAGAGCLQAYGTLGPMARCVEDLALGLSVLSGADGLDAGAPPVALGNRADVDIRKLRVAYFTDNGIVTPTQEIQDAVLRAVRVFADLGVPVTEARPQGIERTFELHWEPFFTMCDGGETVSSFFKNLPLESISPLRQQYHRDAKRCHLTAAELNQRFAEIVQFRRNTFKFLTEYDVLICPPCATTAKPHGRCLDEVKDFTYAMSFNNSGSPAVVIPFGTSAAGLPIGVQVVANLWKDHVALAAAQVLEAAHRAE